MHIADVRLLHSGFRVDPLWVNICAPVHTEKPSSDLTRTASWWKASPGQESCNLHQCVSMFMLFLLSKVRSQQSAQFQYMYQD